MFLLSWKDTPQVDFPRLVSIERLLFAFIFTLSRCSLKLSLLSMVTPKIFAEDRGDRVWSPNMSGKAMVAAASVVRVPGLMKCRSWNFDGSKVEPWVLLHWVQLWYTSLRVL